MNNACFVNNDFRGFGAVLLEQTADPFAAGANFLTNNYAQIDDDLACEFAAYFETGDDRNSGNFTCVPAQVDSCGGEAVDVESPNVETSDALPSLLSMPWLLANLGLLCIIYMS